MADAENGKLSACFQTRILREIVDRQRENRRQIGSGLCGALGSIGMLAVAALLLPESALIVAGIAVATGLPSATRPVTCSASAASRRRKKNWVNVPSHARSSKRPRAWPSSRK
jgi:hypothetical protein